MLSPNEEKFMHDFANPISNALYLVDSLLEEWTAQSALVESSDFEQLQNIYSAVRKLKQLFEERRHDQEGKETIGSCQRKFIHDIANPLGTMIFLAGSLLECAQDRSYLCSDNPKRLEEIMAIFEKLKKMLHDRRELLIQEGVPSSKCA